MAVTIVQQVQGNSTDEYGLHGVEMTCTPGNTLVLFAGWDTSATPTSALSGAVYVSDSAGNYWQHLMTSDPGLSAARCSIWVCANVQAVTWVSASLNWYASSLAYSVVEISGLPTLADADFVATDFSTGATSLTLSATASQIDTVLALFAVPAGTASGVTGPAGFTALTTATGGSGDPNPITIFPYWSLLGGSVSASFTPSSSTALAGVMVGLLPAPSPPVIQTSNFPLLKVEAGFGHLPGDPSSAPPIWTDITSYAMTKAGGTYITSSYGRQYELSTPEAGELTVALSNVSGDFTPGNQASPFYSNALNSNYDFESGITPWTAGNGAAIQQSSAYAYEGSYSAQITPDGSTTYPQINSEHIAVSPSSAYTASAWIFTTVPWGSGFQAQIFWFDSSFTFLSTSSGIVTYTVTGKWSLVRVTGTPPATAVWAQACVQYAGTPASSVVSYVDMAGLAAGPMPVQDDLLRVGTPMRVSAWWSGRWHHIAHGYVERWPNDWPDLPQWGFSKMIATDAIGALTSITMPSAVAGDILIDNPYAYFRGNEQYFTVFNGLSGGFFQSYSFSEANGLLATNYARDNQRPAYYVDGSAGAVETGTLLELLGDSGTGFGVSSVTIHTDGATYSGAGAIYRDPGLPDPESPNGVTIEFYATGTAITASQPNAPGATPQIVGTLTTASSYRPPFGNILPAFQAFLGNNAPYQGLALSFSSLDYLGFPTVPTSAFIGTPAHFAFTFSHYAGGTASCDFVAYLNGSAVYSTTLPPTQSYDWGTLLLGNAQSAWGYYPGDETGNYTAGHYAIYDYQLPASRISAHYLTGVKGRAGDTAPQRIARTLCWGYASIPRGGPITYQGTYDGTFFSDAYSLNGTTGADALNQVAVADRGWVTAHPSGTLEYLFRWWTFNRPISATFGDNAGTPLNPNPDFASGITGWEGYGASIQGSTPPAGGVSPFSAEVTPDTTQTVAQIFQTPGTTSCAPGDVFYVSAWVYSPTGWSDFRAGAGWYDAAGSFLSTSISSAIAVAPGEWTLIYSGALTAPASAASVSALAEESGSPGAGDIFYAEQLQVVSGDEVPFDKNLAFDFDNTYLYNNVSTTLQKGPNMGIIVYARDPVSQDEYFNRAALQQQIQTTGDLDPYSISNYNIAKYKEPQVRVRQIVVESAPNPQSFSAALTVRVGDVCQVIRRPLGGSIISETCVVEKVQRSIGPGVWTTTYQMSPYIPEDKILSMDGAEDILGENTLS